MDDQVAPITASRDLGESASQLMQSCIGKEAQFFILISMEKIRHSCLFIYYLSICYIFR
jgi:hypothetical protein